MGPGKALFGETFYDRVKGALKHGGYATFQTGVPFYQPWEITEALQELARFFPQSGLYLTVVPTYIGGFMALSWAGKGSKLGTPAGITQGGIGRIRKREAQDRLLQPRHPCRGLRAARNGSSSWCLERGQTPANASALYDASPRLGIAWTGMSTLRCSRSKRRLWSMRASRAATPRTCSSRTRRAGCGWSCCATISVSTSTRSSKQIGAPRFSFGSGELLIATLGVPPGSVTPFALINDRERKVRVVLDEAMLALEPLNFHPLRNDRTIAVSAADLLKFIADCGHIPQIVTLPEAS